MRVAVVGGGAAGLTTAWLLDREHDVTLFERDDRLGGHADTRTIEIDGRPIDVDAGFQFFSPGPAYATFNRLLDALGVVRDTYPATITVSDTRSGRALAMPPTRGRQVAWPSLAPASLDTLLRFRRFLNAIPPFLARRDTTVTVAEYLEQAELPKSFADEFLVPLLLSFWCVDREEFLGFAACNALYYLGVNADSGLRAPVQSEIPGGLKVYVDALASSLERTQVRTDAAITRLSRAGESFLVETSDGVRAEFDRVVLACNARQAGELVSGIPGLERLREQLGRFRTFDTRIAIHGDRRLMPRDEASWSVVNARWDGTHSSLTVWNPRHGAPVFKSWITHDDDLPEPLYALATYEHGCITPEYFDAQSTLKGLNGQQGLWLAGLYMHDVDSHESAIRSAVAVAYALAPDSPRLHSLVNPR
ncbi:FAD-dependent oxidoreductase [Agromyces allii]|uniref:NAD(P)/FAD-dependent oxidoreductase n=1 Tax=Agromyces allii TaxID=393607 RepID=A0ABN2Q7R0_9MICO|nr:FAD-dependent oxidoreductase [Agromyces allii]